MKTGEARMGVALIWLLTCRGRANVLRMEELLILRFGWKYLKKFLGVCVLEQFIMYLPNRFQSSFGLSFRKFRLEVSGGILIRKYSTLLSRLQYLS